MTHGIRSHSEGHMTRHLNFNTFLIVVALGALSWIGHTVMKTSEAVRDLSIHQEYNSMRLERLESMFGLKPLPPNK